MNESFHHLFLTCPGAIEVWKEFAGAVGIQGPFSFLKETIYKWWNVQCSSKLKPVFNVVPCFISWGIWKRRNTIRHGDNWSLQSLVMEVCRRLHRLARYLYP